MPKRLSHILPAVLSKKDQSGQIAIIVLLIMVVLLILGLSLARRTSEEILLSGQTEDSARVFNAAETGIDDALSQLNIDPTVTEGRGTVGTAQYSYSVTPTGDVDQILPENQAATVYLDTNPSSITIYWAKESTCADRAALIVSIYYDHGNSVVHEAVKPKCGYPADQATGFSDTSVDEGSYTTEGYKSRFTLTLPSATYANMVFARIRPLYAQTDLRVSGAGDQQYVIRAEGTESDTSADGRSEQRAIEVTRTRPAPPSIFDYALYSGGTLSK